MRFLELAAKGSKTDAELQEELGLATSLANQGLAAPNNTALKDLLKGTAYDPAKVGPLLLGNVDPTQTDINAILSGALNTRSTVNTKSNVVTNTQRTTTNYVDLPTPEEFLDDFNNAFAMHIQGLAKTGAVRPEVAAFAANELKTQLFGDYLRAQTAQLLNGNPLYRVVGLNPDAKLLGTRPGDQSQTTAQQQSTTQSSQSQTSAPAAASSGQGAAAYTSTLDETTNAARNDVQNDVNNEAVVQRNKLGVVANLSPLDFLKDQATAQRLNFLYGGQKGAAVREARTAAGQDFSGAARRI